MLRLRLSLLSICLIFLLSACASSTLPGIALERLQSPGEDQPAALVQPISIPLAGPLQNPQAELSGMDWYGEWLVLLPQYPHWFGPGDGVLFLLPKQEILDFLEGRRNEPLSPRLLPLDASGIRQSIPGFEGYEAIAFWGEQVFVTVESGTSGKMQGWLFAGEIAPDLSILRLSAQSRAQLPPQAPIRNMSDETVLVVEEEGQAVVVTLYEAYGHVINPDPVARRFTTDLSPLEPIPFPHVEYRITDATRVDKGGRFWAINYLWPGEWELLLRRYWMGDTPPVLSELFEGARLEPVERLIEFQYTPSGITFTGTPPINLELLGDGTARNWEGIVRLDNRGFLLATDKHPQTILAFVPLADP
jgi:hypothetical protein